MVDELTARHPGGERVLVEHVAAGDRDAARGELGGPSSSATSPRQLLTEPGLGPLTAAKLVGEIAGANRFATDAKLARSAGLAPIPVSSSRTDRHRLDHGGNRQINAAIHRVAVTRARCHQETIEFVARKKAEGKTHRKAIRCLKRHLARRIWHLLREPTRSQKHRHHHQLLDVMKGPAPAGLGW